MARSTSTSALEAPAAVAAPRAVAATATKKKRWDALDLFRFTAVMLMVQGHAFFVVVDEAIRPEKWYRWHNYVHGYTAPMFMYASGLAFGITTLRRWNEHTHFGKPVFKRLERYLLIIGIGYLLHLPGFSMASLGNASEQTFLNFLKVDALQVIGATLIGCELLAVAIKRRGAYVATVGALGLIAVLAAPAIHRLPTGGLHPALSGYLSNAGTSASAFPLFPWAAFMCAGIVTAYFIQRALDAEDPDALSKLSHRLVAVGGSLMLATVLLSSADLALFGEHNFWKTNPWFFFWRVGILLVLLTLLGHLANALGRVGPPGPIRKTVQVMGMETLVIYVAHLLVLYGTPIHLGLHRTIGKTLQIPEALAAVGLLFASMAALAWGWHLLKTKRPTVFFWTRMAMLAAVLGWVFFSR